MLPSTHREGESYFCGFLQMLSTAATFEVSVVFLQCSLPCQGPKGVRAPDLRTQNSEASGLRTKINRAPGLPRN